MEGRSWSGFVIVVSNVEIIYCGMRSGKTRVDRGKDVEGRFLIYFYVDI